MGEIVQDRLARFAARITDGEAFISEICERVGTPEEDSAGGSLPPPSLIDLCKLWNLPYARVLGWLMADELRYARYKRALEIAAHALVSKCVEIADGDSPYVQRDRLRVQTRQFLARVHAPEMYADRTEIKHSGEISFSLALQQIAAKRGRLIEAEPEDSGI